MFYFITEDCVDGIRCLWHLVGLCQVNYTPNSKHSILKVNFQHFCSQEEL